MYMRYAKKCIIVCDIIRYNKQQSAKQYERHQHMAAATAALIFPGHAACALAYRTYNDPPASLTASSAHTPPPTDTGSS